MVIVENSYHRADAPVHFSVLIRFRKKANQLFL